MSKARKVSLVALAVVLAATTFLIAGQAGAAKRPPKLTPGTLYLGSGHSELLFSVYNPTGSPVDVVVDLKNPVGNWDLTSYEFTVPSGGHGGVSLYCDDVSYCGADPVIKAGPTVLNIRYDATTGDTVFIQPNDFKRI